VNTNETPLTYDKSFIEKARANGLEFKRPSLAITQIDLIQKAKANGWHLSPDGRGHIRQPNYWYLRNSSPASWGWVLGISIRDFNYKAMTYEVAKVLAWKRLFELVDADELRHLLDSPY
jgi:hypothetical protein